MCFRKFFQKYNSYTIFWETNFGRNFTKFGYLKKKKLILKSLFQNKFHTVENIVFKIKF